MEGVAFVVALVGQEVATEPLPLPRPCLLSSVSCTILVHIVGTSE